MMLKNHLGETFELKVIKYHFNLNEIKIKQFNSDWLDVKIEIRKDIGTISKSIECFLTEDLDRIMDWINGFENNTSKKRLYFLDTNLVFMRIKRSFITFVKVVYFINDKDFISWDFEINKENVFEFKNKIQQYIKLFPCRCGMLHNYSKGNY
ncbi:WapI family immunity protein [Flavobacterium aciduliphilum]|uniref:Uncharacterized protein n=1 Tax=Flavobacterium aciduliphilum TaxID=1101402 RepID=A0A328YIG2_9FLAO|nr:hypothetical protein [Flavobacterium aciduliphilum]RAR73759.1 hypothetical protein CLV55_10378 [Flavobacterium aciduliphilum]